LRDPAQECRANFSTGVISMQRILDFHTHLDQRWFQTPTPSATEMIAALDRFNVEIACVYTLMGFYEDCCPHNDALLQRADQFPQRLIPFATVDPKLGRQSVEELKRCLENPRFRGVKFHPWLQAFAPSMVRETMVALLQLAARYDVPVLFHDGTPPYSTTYQIAELARLVPESKIVLGHAGSADYADAAAQLMRDIPNLYGNYCGSRPGELVHLLETAGPEKIIFGSDFGAAGWRLLPERIDNVLEAGLADDILDLVLYANAARLLHLNERPLTSREASVEVSHKTSQYIKAVGR
jgi:predicted TIM-barrel fold metal-dependent hydrolase